MLHRLRKARDIYYKEGLSSVLNSTFRRVPIEINNLVFRLKNEAPTHIMKEDWDNLLILDACRYDLFKHQIKQTNVDGQLESRISLGSSSEEFLERNFDRKQFYDTVYVNANPYLPRLELADDTFHTVVDCLQAWDEELQTVPPKAVSEAADNAHRRYPNKRLIIHFMQPHYPFIDNDNNTAVGGGWQRHPETENTDFIWKKLQHGTSKMSLSEVKSAYQNNLQVVLEEASSLLCQLNGKAVITSDHGNLLGERLSPIPTRRKYGHPYGVYHEALLKVPWFVIDADSRRTIQADPPVDREKTSDENLDEKLEALGYK